jgi:hypothetical protein
MNRKQIVLIAAGVIAIASFVLWIYSMNEAKAPFIYTLF